MILRPSRRQLVALAAAACILAIAACGSSSGKPGGGKVAAGGSFLPFVECLRAHGVSHIPDPTPGRGFVIPNNVNPDSPAFVSAQKACTRFMPGGGPPPATAAVKQQLFQTARCIRKHGFPSFPDPVSTPPPSSATASLAFGRPGAFIVVPASIDPQSHAFQRAAQACGFPRFH
jgi:hypothetical protein